MNHLCIVSPSLKMGGIQRSLVGLANFFVEKGLKVSFITCFSVPPLYKLDERVIHIDHGKKRKTGESPLSKLLFYLFLVRYVRKNVKRLKPDAVLTFGDIMGPFVLGALYGLQVPKYISDRTSADYKFKFPLPWLKKALYPTSSGFFAQTSKAAKLREKQFNGKLRIIILPNGVREIKKYDVPREKVILYVGRFAWEKSPERLLEAFAKLNNPEWTLEMAGDGPLLEKMKAYAKELSIYHKVIFHGQVEDVDLLYSRASVFVLPSILEGFPNALCEAMAAGLPCICFETIPYEDILTNGLDGLVVDSSDENALFNKLKQLIISPEMRKEIGKNAEAIKERLSIERAGNTVHSEIFGRALN